MPPPGHQRDSVQAEDRTSVAGSAVPFREVEEVHDSHRWWSADGTWERILRAVQAHADAEGLIDWSVVSVDSTSCRAHQHAAGALTRAPKMPSRGSRSVRHRSDEALGRSRGGLTCKIHLAGEGGHRPLGFVITPGQWGDAPQMIPVLEEIRVSQPDGGRPRTRPDHLGGRQSVLVAPQPASSAKAADQAHDRRAERPAGQPPAPRQ